MAKGANFTNFILFFFLIFVSLKCSNLKSPSPSNPLKLQLRWKTWVWAADKKMWFLCGEQMSLYCFGFLTWVTSQQGVANAPATPPRNLCPFRQAPELLVNL